MATALTTVTTQPIRHDLQVYGGDDVTRSSEGWIGRFVSWERDPSSCCCPSAVKAWVLFFVDKLFTFLDWTGISHWIYDQGLQETRRVCMEGQMAPERNRVARERIINALGGPEACQTIPVVTLPHADLQRHILVSDEHFPQGHWMIQGEDAAGRKFVALRVKLTRIETAEVMGGETQRIYPDLRIPRIITFHQQQRETDVGGRFWARNVVVHQIVPANLHDHTDLNNNGLDEDMDNNSLSRTIRNLRENGSIVLTTTSGLVFRGQILFKFFTFERNPRP